jgi:hypothetical protein
LRCLEEYGIVFPPLTDLNVLPLAGIIHTKF